MANQELKLAWRHLRKKKVYSLVILLSLAISFACSTLLVSFLLSEGKVDSFHTRRDRLFQIFSDDPFGSDGRIAFISHSFTGWLANRLPGNLPAITSFENSK